MGFLEDFPYSDGSLGAPWVTPDGPMQVIGGRLAIRNGNTAVRDTGEPFTSLSVDVVVGNDQPYLYVCPAKGPGDIFDGILYIPYGNINVNAGGNGLDSVPSIAPILFPTNATSTIEINYDRTDFTLTFALNGTVLQTSSIPSQYRHYFETSNAVLLGGYSNGSGSYPNFEFDNLAVNASDEEPPAYKLRDRLDRADGLLTGSQAETGQTWTNTAGGGSFAISGNRLIGVASGMTQANLAPIGAGPFKVSADLTLPLGTGARTVGLFVRRVGTTKGTAILLDRATFITSTPVIARVEVNPAADDWSTDAGPYPPYTGAGSPSAASIEVDAAGLTTMTVDEVVHYTGTPTIFAGVTETTEWEVGPITYAYGTYFTDVTVDNIEVTGPATAPEPVIYDTETNPVDVELVWTVEAELVGGTVDPPTPQPVFQDFFYNGGIDGPSVYSDSGHTYTSHDSTWAVEAYQAYRATSGPGSQNVHYAPAGEDVADGEFILRGWFTGPASGDFLTGTYIGDATFTSGVLFVYGVEDGAPIQRVNDLAGTALYSGPVAGDPRGTHTVRTDLLGTDVGFYVDDVLVTTLARTVCGIPDTDVHIGMADLLGPFGYGGSRFDGLWVEPVGPVDPDPILHEATTSPVTVDLVWTVEAEVVSPHTPVVIETDIEHDLTMEWEVTAVVVTPHVPVVIEVSTSVDIDLSWAPVTATLVPPVGVTVVTGPRYRESDQQAVVLTLTWTVRAEVVTPVLPLPEKRRKQLMRRSYFYDLKDNQ